MSQPSRVPVRLAFVLAACGACASDPVPQSPSRPVARAEAARSEAPAATATIPASDPAVYHIPLKTLSGEPTTLAEHRGKALLIVNVASECGLTPQYAGLEELQRRYGLRGFEVIGFPCNQFGGQEPGDPEQIRSFCSSTYGVTFPLMEKIEVNGPGRHALYEELVLVPDATGAAGDVQWNFEKFVVSADGERIVRFRPRTEPGSLEVVAAIEAALP
jgi:glutathione peroxidase